MKEGATIQRHQVDASSRAFEVILTCLKAGGGFLIISSMAHLTVACLMFESYSLELAMPDGVPLDLS